MRRAPQAQRSGAKRTFVWMDWTHFIMKIITTGGGPKLVRDGGIFEAKEFGGSYM